MKKWAMLVGVVAPFVFLIAIAGAQEDAKKFPSCSYCGMSREQFAHSRMLVEYDNGTAGATCSLHCMALELAIHMDKTPKAIYVGDLKDKKLIDAEKAFWVTGGNKLGVMNQEGELGV